MIDYTTVGASSANQALKLAQESFKQTMKAEFVKQKNLLNPKLKQAYELEEELIKLVPLFTE